MLEIKNHCMSHQIRSVFSALIVAVLTFFDMGVALAATIQWGPVQSAVVNSPYGGVVAGPPDDSTGGFNFSAGAPTPYGSDADVVFGNNGTIGAIGIALARADFSSSSESAPESFLTYLRARNVGDTYIVKLRNNKHVKIRIDSLTAGVAWYTYSRIGFSYRIESSESTPVTPSSSSTTYLIDCARQPLPGSVSCSTATSMGTLWRASDLEAVVTTQLGCANLGQGIYSCGSSTPYPGFIIIYLYAGATSSVSRIIYLH